MKKTLLLVLLYTLQINAQCWKQIVGGHQHSLGLKTDGSLWAWGNNPYGQLGDGTTVTRLSPVQIGTDTNWKSISVSFEGEYSLALKTNGTIWSWGENYLGQLGDGSTTDRHIPTQIGTDSDWKFVSAGGEHCLAQKINGTLWAWGDNTYGDLGIGNQNMRTHPLQVGTANDWKVICAGDDTNLAIKNDGTLWAWGDNTDGNLGNGSSGVFAYSNVPIQIGTATNWKEIFIGDRHSVAIKSDGTLWGWGYNGSGGLGDATSFTKIVPTQIGTATNWLHAYCGWDTSHAIKTDSTLWGWGNNSFGQVGDGTNTTIYTPIQIGTYNDYVYFYNGQETSYAFRANGDYCGWGKNTFGNLGNGNTNEVDSPTLISHCTLGVSENLVASFKIYPNPVKNVLTIQNVTNASLNGIIVIDLTGKRILEQKGNISQLNVDGLVQGLYMLELDYEGGKQIEKIIKQQ